MSVQCVNVHVLRMYIICEAMCRYARGFVKIMQMQEMCKLKCVCTTFFNISTHIVMWLYAAIAASGHCPLPRIGKKAGSFAPSSIAWVKWIDIIWSNGCWWCLHWGWCWPDWHRNGHRKQSVAADQTMHALHLLQIYFCFLLFLILLCVVVSRLVLLYIAKTIIIVWDFYCYYLLWANVNFWRLQ